LQTAAQHAKKKNCSRQSKENGPSEKEDRDRKKENHTGGEQARSVILGWTFARCKIFSENF
jgi:hypothetical protein